MRILFVTQWFDPEPAFKGLAFARQLTARGHTVQVLTGFPNYPGGNVYPGYRIRLTQREELEGIEVIRVPLYPSHSVAVAGRAANYLSFAASAATIGASQVTKPDVIYAYHPPATIGIPALAVRAIHGVPLVYDVQDMWPDTVFATGMIQSRMSHRILDAFCRFVYARADHITVVTPGFKRTLIERGVPAGKITVIYNWSDEAQAAVPESAAPDYLSQWAGKFLVVFAGTMGPAQALDSVLDAAQLVEARQPNVHVLFIGGGVDVERLKLRPAAMNLRNVSFLPRVSTQEIGRVLARADAVLVHLKDDPLFQITIPSKTQAYMAAGRPILMAVRGDAEALIREANCGISCCPENPLELANAMEAMATQSPERRQAMGENGRAFYESRLSLSRGVGAFEAIFESLRSPVHQN